MVSSKSSIQLVVENRPLLQPLAFYKQRAGFKQIAERLDRFGAEQISRLLDAVNRRAEELGLPVPIRPANRFFDLKLATSSELVVRRKRIGTLPLDDLSPAEREGYPSGAWNIIPITALYWCDGHRSLAEVARVTWLEWGSLNFDVEGYFRVLARHGYVNLNKPARQKWVVRGENMHDEAV